MSKSQPTGQNRQDALRLHQEKTRLRKEKRLREEEKRLREEMRQSRQNVRQFLKDRLIYFEPFQAPNGIIRRCGPTGYDGIRTLRLNDPAKSREVDVGGTYFSPRGRYRLLDGGEAQALAGILRRRRGFLPVVDPVGGYWCFWANPDAKRQFDELQERNRRLEEERKKKLQELEWKMEEYRRREREEYYDMIRTMRSDMRCWDGEWLHEDHF